MKNNIYFKIFLAIALFLLMICGECGDKRNIQTKEIEEACNILNAKPIFAGQIDVATIVNNEWRDKTHELLLTENPDIVFTH